MRVALHLMYFIWKFKGNIIPSCPLTGGCRRRRLGVVAGLMLFRSMGKIADLSQPPASQARQPPERGHEGVASIAILPKYAKHP